MPAVVFGHGRCAEFPSWLKIGGWFLRFFKKYKPRIVEFDGMIVGMVLVYLYFNMMEICFYTERVGEEVHVTLNRKKPWSG